ncbi:trypsin-like serine protease [Vibrio sp. CUB2]|uniref:trypsin-like serine protease n=1 Tax=Vibrio sp. CUB2 TaxID=2315233 RepID=UPI00076A4E78|nr:trypsin-like serine protease [Vibrio sp. CUB2]
MLNKTFTFISFALLSSQAFAVENGTPINWAQQNNTVQLENSTDTSKYCTATIVAGHYAVTAAHCLDEEGLDTLTTALGESIPITRFINHPSFIEDGSFSGEDIGIVTVAQPIEYSNIQFLNIENREEGEPVIIAGFGGTIDTLNSVALTFSHYHWADHFALYADVVDEDKHTTGGDSGAAWVNETNEIIAVHKGSTLNFTTDTRETYGTDIQAVQDFLTSNIDGWHYPTLADANGRTTITVQSLHQGGVIDSAYTEGDITLLTNESTCITKGTISPFEQCTYVIESNGDEGKLFLSDSESVHINKPEDNAGGGNSGSGDSGGSLGFWSLLLLSIASLRRKR